MSQSADTAEAEPAEPKQVKARLTDPALIEAIEGASEERSTAEAIREAIRAAYVGGEDSDRDGYLAGMLGDGYEVLREAVGREANARLSLSAAESRVAAECNIPKDAVRSGVLSQLRRRGYISIHQGIRAVVIVVHPPEAVKGGEYDG